MSCSNCQEIKSIATCVNQIIIGTISSKSVDVYVYYKNIATGRITRMAGQSDSNGLVTVDVSAESFVSNQTYEFWITLTDSGIECKEDVSIVDCAGTTSDTTYTCFSVKFYMISQNDIAYYYYETQTFTL